MLTAPRPAELVAVLFSGSVCGFVGFGLVGMSVWFHIRQPWYVGLCFWGGTGILLGFLGTLSLIQYWSAPRKIINLNESETRVYAIVPDRTEGTIGTFPLPPGELRILAGELLQPHVRFTEADFRSRYGIKKFKEIKRELFARKWAIPDYRGTPELTVAGRNVLSRLANPPAHPTRRMSIK